MDSQKETKLQNSILEKMNPTIRESLNFEQRREIAHLIERITPMCLHKHILDTFFRFWLIKRWYIRFIFGHDDTCEKRIITARQEKTFLSVVLNIIFTFIMIMGVLATLFLLFYLAKTILGIDLFPDKHLVDML